MWTEAYRATKAAAVTANNAGAVVVADAAMASLSTVVATTEFKAVPTVTVATGGKAAGAYKFTV